MDKLKIQELRTELWKRSLSTAGKKKPQLEKEFDELRRGITNVPALLQGVPEMTLMELCLDSYEVSPVEPLHDLKGHLSNIIEELRVTLTGEVKEKVDIIVGSVLGKETLRGSDYRKGSILILKTLQEVTPNSPLTTLLSTAVEMTELLYCDPTKRTSQSVLRLHNITFVHAKLCVHLFGKPKTISSRRMFGRYFHALTNHAPLLNRIISLCLLNTELEERMFGQCKGITRSTSNQHATHIITNILVRLDSEEKRQASGTSTIQKQESEILKLAQTLPPKENTVIPLAWLQNSSVHYQAHLERISDYLLPGPGKWWQYVADGIEYFDVNTPNPLLQTPSIHHFRSTTMGDVDIYLLTNWEKCLEVEVQLPAYYIRTYGNTHNIRACNPHATHVNADLTYTMAPTEPLQARPYLSCTPLSSRALTQPTKAQPSLSCIPLPSRALSQLTQAQPSLSCIPLPSRAPSQLTQAQPSLSCTPLPSRAPSQPTQAQPSLLCTPLSSRAPSQPTQAQPSLSCTPLSSRGTLLSPKCLQLTKPGPCSSLALSILPVISKNMHDKVLAFDLLRNKAKTAKANNTTSRVLVQQYQAASATLSDELLEQLKTNCQLIQNSETSADAKEIEHKNNIIKKILSHEWNIKTLNAEPAETSRL